MIEYDVRDVGDDLAQMFQREVYSYRDRVEAQLLSLGFSDTFAGDIHVQVYDYTPPASQALLPAWNGHRGRMKFAALRVRQGRAAVVHELVHVYAPNQVRFLAEGLSVYLEEMIGNIEAYPTFGTSIVDRLRTVNSAILDTVDLRCFDQVSVGGGLPLGNAVKLEAVLIDPSKRGTFAYLVAGSFVKFVLQLYGADQFRALYELTPLTPLLCKPAAVNRYETIFAKPVGQLQREWLDWLREL
jgi:hypothetical protein